MTKFGGIVIAILFGGFWCGITFLADGAFTWNLARQLVARGYAETTGVITHSDVKVEHDSDGSSHTPEVHYRYEVAGKPLEGKRIRYDLQTFNRARTDEIIRDYPLGQKVAVFYDPAVPADAVLERDIDLANSLPFLFLAPFNAVAFTFVGGIFAWLRSKRLGRPVLGIAVRDDGLSVTIRVYNFSPAFAALIAWGAAGFLCTFGVLLGSFAVPLESAVALGWSATLAATIVAWRYAIKSYSEIRRDSVRGTVEIRETDGAEFSLAEKDLQPCKYSHRTDTDSEGDKSEKYPLELPYSDPASNAPRTLKLPEQTSEEDAILFVSWLNSSLGLADPPKEIDAAVILEK